MTSFIIISLGADCNGEQILGRRGSGRFDGGGGGFCWACCSAWPVYVQLWQITRRLPPCVQECFDVTNDSTLNDALCVCPHVSEAFISYLTPTETAGLPVCVGGGVRWGGGCSNVDKGQVQASVRPPPLTLNKKKVPPTVKTKHVC